MSMQLRLLKKKVSKEVPVRIGDFWGMGTYKVAYTKETETKTVLQYRTSEDGDWQDIEVVTEEVEESYEKEDSRKSA